MCKIEDKKAELIARLDKYEERLSQVHSSNRHLVAGLLSRIETLRNTLKDDEIHDPDAIDNFIIGVSDIETSMEYTLRSHPQDLTKPRITDLSDPATRRRITWDFWMQNKEYRETLTLLTMAICKNIDEITRRIMFAIPEDRQEKFLNHWTRVFKVMSKSDKPIEVRPGKASYDKLKLALAAPTLGEKDDLPAKIHRSDRDASLLVSIFNTSFNDYTFTQHFSELFVTDLINL